PFQGPARPVTVAHRGEHFTSDPNLRMTIHASLRCGNRGVGGMLHGGVAIAAVDAQDADMVLVTEGDWLDADDSRVGAVGGTGVEQAKPQNGEHEQERTDEADLGDRVGAAGENLRHERLLLRCLCDQSGLNRSKYGAGEKEGNGPVVWRRDYTSF